MRFFKSDYLERMIYADQLILKPNDRRRYSSIGDGLYTSQKEFDGREELHLLVVGQTPTPNTFGIYRDNGAIFQHRNLGSGNADLVLHFGVELLCEIPPQFQATLSRVGQGIEGIVLFGENAECAVRCVCDSSNSRLTSQIDRNTFCTVRVRDAMELDNSLIPRLLVSVEKVH